MIIPSWLAVLFLPLLKCLAGWFQNASADGKFEYWEWRKLLETAIPIILTAVIARYGLGLNEVMSASIVTMILVGLDQVKNAVVKARKS